jgi:hypothetical protein
MQVDSAVELMLVGVESHYGLLLLVGLQSAVVYRASDEGGLNEYHAVEADLVA